VLKTRLISAAVMAPLVIGCIYYLPTPAVAALMALVIAGGAREWVRMIPLYSTAGRFAYPGGVVLLMALLWVAPLSRVITPVLLLALLWWLGALYWLSRPEYRPARDWQQRLLKSLAGMLVMVPAWAALASLHGYAGNGPLLCLYVLVLVWVADSGAYFTGRYLGRRKLAPLISPGKTREGVYGAVLASGLLALLVGLLSGQPGQWTAGLVLVSLLAVLFSVAGDLLESLMKRQCGIKDSGSIIPGHGGILDRIDSLTAALPVFLLGMQWAKL
jgi:phosphatidate cytidylyltransferase